MPANTNTKVVELGWAPTIEIRSTTNIDINTRHPDNRHMTIKSKQQRTTAMTDNEQPTDNPQSDQHPRPDNQHLAVYNQQQRLTTIQLTDTSWK